ncbi:MAG: hypothetical protein QF911_07270 [Candidatus Thalassarchaeaceae archaeon]|jgi:hypothetical protein|nr:hypothetical protein [Candidatus Thalassarchaeaceae archaeon]
MDISPPSLPPRSEGDDHWEPGLLHAMAVVVLLAAYWSGWLDALWPF